MANLEYGAFLVQAHRIGHGKGTADQMKTLEDLTKEQLINDLVALRKRMSELEKIEEDKKKNELELSRTRAMFEGLFEFAPDAILVVDQNGRIIRVNNQTERLFGYSRSELLDRQLEILLPERFRETHKEHRKMYLAEPRVRPMGRELELYGRRKDGSEFHVDIALGPLKIEQDFFVLAVIRDFTGFKQSESDRLKEKSLSDATIENMPGIFYLVDEQGNFLRWNKNLEKASGYSTLEISKMCLQDFFDGEDKEAIEQTVANLGDAQFSAEAGLSSKDGGKTPYFFTGSQVNIDRAQCLVGIGVDMTERKQMEKMLRETVEHSNEMNSALKALLRQREEDRKEFEEATLSNIKTLILPYLQSLKMSQLNARQTTLVGIIESHLGEISSNFTRKLSLAFMNLTAAELKVATLVRDGRSTVEIAEALNISEKAVEFHRGNIRAKLGLKGQKGSLMQHLLKLT
jgi:PAS domain S-box-containing protein